jgi:hypothetical protein
MKLTKEQIEEILERAKAGRKQIAKVASDPQKFRMTIPPQPYDTDMLIVGICRDDIPALVAHIEAQAQQIRDLEAASAWTHRDNNLGHCVRELVHIAGWVALEYGAGKVAIFSETEFEAMFTPLKAAQGEINP